MVASQKYENMGSKQYSKGAYFEGHMIPDAWRMLDACAKGNIPPSDILPIEITSQAYLEKVASLILLISEKLSIYKSVDTKIYKE